MSGATWRLPGFVLGEQLGSGNSGEVWAARIAATGEQVALKRVALTGPDALRAARTEAALLATLDHPHLVRVHALLPTSDAAVLVLDLADGGSLADVLERRGRLSVGEVVTALAPIGAALAYAHQHGVMHGDVSPANILFMSIGLPMLGDLGVARIIGDSAPVRCTPEYVDPAVARGCAPGPSSDVFMLGAVALRALTGSPIWRGATTAELLADAAAGDLGHLPERLAGLPRSVAAVLEQALEREPHLRCTAAEFSLDLRHSEVPMPVELSAGRPLLRRSAAGRGAAGNALVRRPEPGAHRAAARHRPGNETVDRGQPAFDRPGPAPATPGHDGALTRRVRAPARPTLPPPPGPVGRLLARLSAVIAAPRALRLGATVVMITGMAVAGALLWSSRPSTADVARQPGYATPLPRSDGSLPARSPPLAAGEVLRRLDDLREEAFAHRDPKLLARVYAPGPLLDQDTALLRRIVPIGCGLVGARTDFRDVQVVSAAATTWTVRAMAQLAPSSLRCGGVVSGHAAGTGPTGLRVQLTQEAGQFRIASQLPG